MHWDSTQNTLIRILTTALVLTVSSPAVGLADEGEDRQIVVEPTEEPATPPTDTPKTGNVQININNDEEPTSTPVPENNNTDSSSSDFI